MTTYNGKCHCGETEWTVKLEEPSHVLCHCDACKLIGGGCEYTMNILADKSDFNVTKGSFKSYSYKGDSGKDVICNYCPTCTSHAYHHQLSMGAEKLVVRSAFLEGNKEWPVTVELYGKDRAAWQQPAVGAQSFDVVPPN